MMANKLRKAQSRPSGQGRSPQNGGFPPEADAIFDVVTDEKIAAWREKLNDRFGIGKGNLKPIAEPAGNR